MSEDTFEILLKMNGVLRRFFDSQVDCLRVKVSKGDTVDDVLGKFGANDEVWLIAVNHEIVTCGFLLSEGDFVECFEAMEGG